MKIAIAQMNTVPGEFDITLNRMLEQSRAAAEQGANLIIFPPSVFAGLDPVGLLRAESFVEELASSFDALVRDLACPALVCMNEPMLNSPAYEVFLINDGQPMPLRLLSWIEGIAQGSSAHEAAAGSLSFELAGTRITVVTGMNALDDLADHPDGSQIVILMQSGAFNVDDEESLLVSALDVSDYRVIAQDLGAWLIAASGVGGYESLLLCGGSFALAPWGELLAMAPPFEEDLLIFDVDVASEGPLEHPLEAPQLQRDRLLWDALVLASRDYIHKAGFSEAVIPLEGDFATSALAVLAVDALGPVCVDAVICDSGSPERLADAREVARNLRIDVLEEVKAPAGDGLRAESLLAASLADHAAKLGALPLGAHDKTYWALECNAPAASAALFEPFGDVYRSDLAAMMRRRMTVSPSVPPSALVRFQVPLSDFVPGTTPEERLSTIDACLLHRVEQEMNPLDIVDADPLMGIVVELVLERLGDCEVYRRASPICPVVSARTISELALPAGTPWRERIAEGVEFAHDGGEFPHDGFPAHMEQAFADLSNMFEESGLTRMGDRDERVNDVLSILHDLSWQGVEGDDSVFGWGLFSRN